MATTEIPLSGVVAEHFRAVNAFDVDAIVSTFAPDAYVNDNRREIRGAAAIRRWVETEMVAEHVTVEPVKVLDHYGDVIVRGRYDGDFDRSGLPDELIMSNYFSLREGKIVSLAVVFNQESEYGSAV
ncbi:nuclear transport factor 2 family protein [Streptomyces sp. SID11233]|uniref:nuclear transport factor 2 family protein n=1 Tax=Streptomyces sp. SID11385 TaxID=2706031 RepID=UPI0013C1F341|nr:nuclear transport factor 2 family protein [Streptomyces sp. SID11385]NEA38575.1 nuclear transport factor 2 family protein [Streptomyces sp. SID11385]NED81322.1 nuclear transport factor 2 family protein [Streptomyces sp. SID11233]